MMRSEKLDVWLRAIEFADTIYAVTKSSPSDERFAWTIQMRRVVSVSPNIDEGSGRVSDKIFAHFLGVAYGSTMKVASQSAIAARQSFLNLADQQ